MVSQKIKTQLWSLTVQTREKDKHAVNYLRKIDFTMYVCHWDVDICYLCKQTQRPHDLEVFYFVLTQCVNSGSVPVGMCHEVFYFVLFRNIGTNLWWTTARQNKLHLATKKSCDTKIEKSQRSDTHASVTHVIGKRRTITCGTEQRVELFLVLLVASYRFLVLLFT